MREQFFQWRKWKAYGSGVAGDLFVHLFSGTHFITGSHGPTRGMATGGLRFWKDGRDVPDVMLGLFDYPEGFNLSLHVNFVDGGEESEGLIFTGSEGTMEIGGNSVSVNRVPREKEPGYTIDTFTEATQKQISPSTSRNIHRTNPEGAPPVGYEKFVAPQGYSDSYDHFKNFFASVRSRATCGGRCGLRLPRGGGGAAEQSEHGARRYRRLGSGGDEAGLIGRLSEPVRLRLCPAEFLSRM
jgi:predicted dehydrogenase